LAGIQLSLGNASKRPAKGSHRNRATKLAEKQQLALDDEEFEDVIPIYTPAAIYDNHVDDIVDTVSYRAVTESLLTEK
jgi:hypothetical protein